MRERGLFGGSRLLRSTCGLALAAAGISAPLHGALAQGASDVAPPTREELTRPQRGLDQRRQMTLTVDGQMQRPPCALDDPQYDDLRFTLNSVSYVGAEAAADVALAQAHQGYTGQELPIRALCDIRDRAAALLDEAGYLAAVDIPAQNLRGGDVEIRVVLGRLVALRARGQTSGGEQQLRAYLGKLVGQPVFNTNDAERYLLLANDIPGMDIRLSLRPAEGGEPGDLVGEIGVRRQEALVDLTVQNYGSRALGRYGGLLRGEYYGLTGMGDRTSIAAFTTLDFEEQHTLQLAHDMLVGSEGLQLGGQLTFGWTEPDAVPGFDVESETFFATLDATYPVLRKQTASIWATGGIDIVNQDVELNGFDLTRDRVRTAFARGNFIFMDEDSIARRGGYSPFEPRFLLSGAVEVRQGLDILSATDDCRPDLLACTTGGATPPSRIEQDPTPLALRGQVAAEFRPIPLLTIAYDMRAQVSGDPLPAFEEFSGGNYTIGRGFDPGAIIGDSGLGLGLELRYGSLRPTSAEAFAFQPYAFVDHAIAWNEDPSTQPFNPDRLTSVGGGVRFVRGLALQGDVNVAIPVQRTDSQAELGDVRILFNLTARLIPWSWSQ